MLNQTIQSWYEAHGQEVKDLAMQLWELSETALEEYESCVLTAKFLEKHGFSVETFNCCDSTKPANTVIASWGAVAAVGHELGLKAAIHAGMAQAQCGYDILKNPAVVNIWRADLDAQLAKEGEIRPIFPERIH